MHDLAQYFLGNVLISETRNKESNLARFVIPKFVKPSVLGVIVDSTIQLDDQSELCAEEVHDESLNDLLPTEMPSFDSATAQNRPGQPFSRSRFSSESAGDLDLGWRIVTRADETPARFVSHHTE